MRLWSINIYWLPSCRLRLAVMNLNANDCFVFVDYHCWIITIFVTRRYILFSVNFTTPNLRFVLTQSTICRLEAFLQHVSFQLHGYLLDKIQAFWIFGLYPLQDMIGFRLYDLRCCSFYDASAMPRRGPHPAWQTPFVWALCHFQWHCI